MAFEPIHNMLGNFALRHHLGAGLQTAEVVQRASEVTNPYGRVRSYRRQILTLVVASRYAAQLAREQEPAIIAKINDRCGSVMVRTLRIIVEPQ